MDWTLAINRNRDALLRVVAALFALMGLNESAKFSTLPRHVYRAVLFALRPAESAARRLIIIAAQGLVLKPVPSRPMPIGLTSKGSASNKRAFPLMDQLKRFSPFDPIQQDTFDSLDSEDAGSDDDYTCGALPRISVPGFFDPVIVAPHVPSPYDLINAAHLSQRLDALKRALANVPKQARRLVRWQARRDLALQQNTPLKPTRLSPCRPGSPPGARLRGKFEIDLILRECHALMLDRLADTS
ncbi:MAG: hypothetical protein ACRCU5_00550 [Rhizobiaceae bacterium]